jgi:hypothetical protein
MWNKEEQNQAAQRLWSLLHNMQSPEGRWTRSTELYYEHVVELFLKDPLTKKLLSTDNVRT